MQQQNYQGQQQPQNNRGNGQGQQAPQAPDKLNLDLEPVDFNGTTKTAIISTVDLASEINSIFRPIFSDYEGSTVIADIYTGQLHLSLYFKDKGTPGKDQLKNLSNVLQDPNNRNVSAIERIQRFNTRNSNKTYELTQGTKEILSDYIYAQQKGKVNWNQCVSEVTEQGHSSYSVYVKVVGIDLIKLLRKKYNKKGAFNDYQINLLKPLGQGFTAMDTSNFLISITQLDIRKVEDLCRKIGMVPTSGSIPMVR